MFMGVELFDVFYGIGVVIVGCMLDVFVVVE